VREVHHVGPDGQPVDYVGVPYSGVAVLPTSTAPNYPHTQFANYEMLASQEPYPNLDPGEFKLCSVIAVNVCKCKWCVSVVCCLHLSSSKNNDVVSRQRCEVTNPVHELFDCLL
jgi:hypothetical protein